MRPLINQKNNLHLGFNDDKSEKEKSMLQFIKNEIS